MAVVAVPGGARLVCPSTACRAAGVWPDGSLGTNALLALGLPAHGGSCPRLPWIRGSLQWQVRLGREMLLPSTATRAAGSTEPLLLAAALISGDGENLIWEEKRLLEAQDNDSHPSSISFQVLPSGPPEVPRGSQGGMQGCAVMLRAAQGYPPPGLPQGCCPWAAEDPHCHLVPPEHQDSREPWLLGAGGPGLLALHRELPSLRGRESQDVLPKPSRSCAALP